MLNEIRIEIQKRIKAVNKSYHAIVNCAKNNKNWKFNVESVDNFTYLRVQLNRRGIITNSMAYGIRRFNVAFPRALQKSLS